VLREVPDTMSISIMTEQNRKSIDSLSDEDASYAGRECSQMHEFRGDRGHDLSLETVHGGGLDANLKRKIDELMKENEELRRSKVKRQKRRPKRTNKGIAFVPLRAIKETDRLGEDRMYTVGKTIRNQIFRNMKFFMEVYKETSLKLAFNNMGTLSKADVIRYTDYVVFYIDKKITAQRNNAIYALKKLVLGLDDEGKWRITAVQSVRTTPNNDTRSSLTYYVLHNIRSLGSA
jgi:hypothetical protein